MAHEANRLEALIKARNSGMAQITGPITLVQDKEQTPGFLFYTPFYNSGHMDSLKLRKASFLGAVYAPFIMKKLIRGVLDEASRHVSLKISDENIVLYNEFKTTHPNYVEKSTFYYSKILSIYGRQWNIELKGSQSFEKAIKNNQPLTILIVGFVIDSLLIFVFLSISNAKKKAVELANSMTQDLQDKMQLLEKSNQYKFEFLSNMSHELRTPLNSIIFLSQLLMKDDAEEFNPETLKMLKIINKGGHTLLMLVNDILDLAKIEAGKMDLNIAKILLSDVKKNMLDEFSISAQEKSLKFYVHLDTKLDKEIETDGDKLLQILRNFLSNALKLTEEGEISLTIRKILANERHNLSEALENGVAFSVKDSGIGLSLEQQKTVFEALTQIDVSLNRQYDGTGLGLSICKSLVLLLGGEIRLISNLGEGAEFILYLPKKLESPFSS